MMQQCTLKQLQQTFQIPTSTATIPAPVHTRLSTDVNQSGEIDVKDFELAIEVSVDKNKKKKQEFGLEIHFLKVILSFRKHERAGALAKSGANTM